MEEQQLVCVLIALPMVRAVVGVLAKTVLSIFAIKMAVSPVHLQLASVPSPEKRPRNRAEPKSSLFMKVSLFTADSNGE
jgi:hypothetical protein